MKLKSKNQWLGYLYLIPIAILIFAFMFFPFCKGIYTAFFQTKYGFGDMKFAGFDNFFSVLKIEIFNKAMMN